MKQGLLLISFSSQLICWTFDIIQFPVDMLGFKSIVKTYMGTCENEGEGGSSIGKKNAMERQYV